MRNTIFITCDRRMFKQSQMLIRSIRKNYPNYPHILFSMNSLTQDEKNNLELIPRLKIHTIQNKFNWQMPLMNSHQLADVNAHSVHARFEMWHAALDEFDNILYIDSDALVLDSLDDLFVSQTPVMIQQPWYSGVLINEKNPALCDALRNEGIELRGLLANDGVLMVPKAYRAKADLLELKSLALRFGSAFIWSDQSLLNLWFIKRGWEFWRAWEYNLCLHRYKDYPNEYDYEATKILHFTNGAEREFLRQFAMWIGGFVIGRKRYIKPFVRYIHPLYQGHR